MNWWLGMGRWGISDMNRSPQNWPPSPFTRPCSFPRQPETVWPSFLPLFCAVPGAILLTLGSTAPSTKGLSGKAFTDAFEAREDVMFCPVFGFPLALAGLCLGYVYRQTVCGKVAMVLSLLSAAWFFLRQY